MREIIGIAICESIFDSRISDTKIKEIKMAKMTCPYVQIISEKDNAALAGSRKSLVVILRKPNILRQTKQIMTMIAKIAFATK